MVADFVNSIVAPAAAGKFHEAWTRHRTYRTITMRCLLPDDQRVSITDDCTLLIVHIELHKIVFSNQFRVQ
jgi:hypothetical protein